MMMMLMMMRLTMMTRPESKAPIDHIWTVVVLTLYLLGLQNHGDGGDDGGAGDGGDHGDAGDAGDDEDHHGELTLITRKRRWCW